MPNAVAVCLLTGWRTPPQLSDLFNEQFTVGEGVTITSLIFRGAPADSDHGPRVRALVLKEALRRLGADDCSERHAQALVTFFLPEVRSRVAIAGRLAPRPWLTSWLARWRLAGTAGHPGREAPDGLHPHRARRHPAGQLRQRRDPRAAAQAALPRLHRRHRLHPAVHRCAPFGAVSDLGAL